MAGKNILVAYGTRYGSARVVADAVKSFFEQKGNNVELVNLRKEKIPDPTPLMKV